MLAAVVVMTMTTGRGGGSAHQLGMGGTEGRTARRGPFYLSRRLFSRRTKERTPITMEVTALKSAAQQSREVPVHQQGLLARLTNCPLLEGSQGVHMPG